MTVIKRNGLEVIFDITKNITAITRGNEAVEEEAIMTPKRIKRIAAAVALNCIRMHQLRKVI